MDLFENVWLWASLFVTSFVAFGFMLRATLSDKVMGRETGAVLRLWCLLACASMVSNGFLVVGAIFG